MIAGVFGGIGQYFKIQPNILRISICLTDYFTGFVPGIMAIYIILVIIMAIRN